MGKTPETVADALRKALDEIAAEASVGIDLAALPSSGAMTFHQWKDGKHTITVIPEEEWRALAGPKAPPHG